MGIVKWEYEMGVRNTYVSYGFKNQNVNYYVLLIQLY